MKKLILALAICLIATTAHAGVYLGNKECVDSSCNTVNINVDKTTDEFNTYVNETTINEKSKKRFSVGVGADVTLYEDSGENAVVEKVTEEYRYDWANGEHAAYTVVHVNLWQKIKGLFNRD